MSEVRWKIRDSKRGTSESYGEVIVYRPKARKKAPKKPKQ